MCCDYLVVPASEVHKTNDGKTIRIEYYEKDGKIFKVSLLSAILGESISFLFFLDHKDIRKSTVYSSTSGRWTKGVFLYDLSSSETDFIHLE